MKNNSIGHVNNTLEAEALPHFTIIRNGRSNLQSVDFNSLEFGKYVSDHMVICDYENGEWNTPRIMPYGNIYMNPASLALHYGQTVFEGMKAFRMANGQINVFRIGRHYDRFVKSLERMCMAIIPKDIFCQGILRLLEMDKEWVPRKEGEALYIRPFMYASEEKFGIKISEKYRFIIFTGPVPALYSHPIKVKVETEFIRAAKGGTGFAKCGGNYAAALYPTHLAKEQGYDQVLWTDGRDHQFIEESGMMNVLFVINGKIVTAPLSDSILDGITRDSLLALAVELGIPIEERPISLSELALGFSTGSVTEAFGAGTAAVVAPIKTIHLEGTDFQLPPYSDQSIMFRLKKKLELIRSGIDEDIFGWNYILP